MTTTPPAWNFVATAQVSGSGMFSQRVLTVTSRSNRSRRLLSRFLQPVSQLRRLLDIRSHFKATYPEQLC